MYAFKHTYRLHVCQQNFIEKFPGTEKFGSMARSKKKTGGQKLPPAPEKVSKEKISKKEQGELTRGRLLAIARDEFSKRGFAGVSTEKLVARAGLTRGALYHQFKDKRALFLACLEDAQGEIVEAISVAVENAADEWAILKDGCRAFLEAASRPELRRIVLIDGPAVLGWDEWRRLDAENGVKELREGLKVMMNHNLIKPRPLDALAMMLSGAMNEAALWIAAADEHEIALKEAGETMDALLDGLRS